MSTEESMREINRKWGWFEEEGREGSRGRVEKGQREMEIGNEVKGAVNRGKVCFIRYS